ncbi:MAG: hypothetical protein N4A49_10590 [Marinifilaceae bacterium]|nr:hypothetical protein [Marinifilaceae bacterium]
MNNKNEISSSLISLTSSLLAFLGIMSCCGFPILAASLAWLGIGASQLSFLSQYRWLFISISIIALLYGFYVVYLKKNKSYKENRNSIEDTNSCCPERPNSKAFAKIALWIGLILVLANLTVFKTPEESSKTNCCTKETNTEQPSCCDKN